MEPLPAVQQAIRAGDYRMTEHALEEADNDDLHLVDIESAILTGVAVRAEDDPARGPKLVIPGLAADLATRVGAVVRLPPTGPAVIITVYEVTR